MKSAIASAVTTYVQAAHRHPRCVTPVVGVPTGDLAAEQAALITELEGKLAAARGENHDLRNQLFSATAPLALVAIAIGLPEDAPAAAILDRVQKLAGVEADRDELLQALDEISDALAMRPDSPPSAVAVRAREIVARLEAR